jgi:hypothetical protein
MKHSLIRFFAVSLFTVALAIFGAIACEESVDLEEAQEATEQVGKGAETPEDGAVPTPPDGEGSTDSEAAGEGSGEAAPSELSEHEQVIIGSLKELNGAFAEGCDKPKKCIKGFNKLFKKNMKIIKKTSKKIKNPSAGFIAACQGLVQQRNDSVKSAKKVGKKLKGKFKKLDGTLKKICQ